MTNHKEPKGTDSRHVVIVGASLAGLRSAEELRALGFGGRISLIGAERHPPYDRPPLSKEILLGTRTPEQARLCGDKALRDLGIDLVLGSPAIDLDEHTRTISLGSGDTINYDVLIIATGVDARRLPDQPHHETIHVLRTLDDSIALRRSMETATSVLIIGGGFIGAEVAAVAKMADLEVTIVEESETLFGRALGKTVGTAWGDMHRDRGVHVHCGSKVSSFFTHGGATGVRLGDGSTLEAECVVVGVGTVPNTHWLRNDEAQAFKGVSCDNSGRALGMRNVYAVGDVAAWPDPLFGDRVRIEHWTNATDQAKIVAHSIVGPSSPRPARGLPYFWSDQYGTRLQVLGRPDRAENVRILDRETNGRPLLYGYYRTTTLVAVASFGSPRLLAKYRPHVASRALDVERAEGLISTN
jgi:3-phenylpropionate/trans-cinnamate dioxygenase ferredoxin reductase subunit